MGPVKHTQEVICPHVKDSEGLFVLQCTGVCASKGYVILILDINLVSQWSPLSELKTRSGVIMSVITTTQELGKARKPQDKNGSLVTKTKKENHIQAWS